MGGIEDMVITRWSFYLSRAHRLYGSGTLKVDGQLYGASTISGYTSARFSKKGNRNIVPRLKISKEMYKIWVHDPNHLMCKCVISKEEHLKYHF